MAQKVLPVGPDEIFRLAEPVLTDVFGEGAYCLGGGTDNLAQLPQDWVTSPHAGSPLLNATAPAHLANDPALCVEAVRDMLDCGRGRSLAPRTPRESSNTPATRRPTPS